MEYCKSLYIREILYFAKIPNQLWSRIHSLSEILLPHCFHIYFYPTDLKTRIKEFPYWNNADFF